MSIHLVDFNHVSKALNCIKEDSNLYLEKKDK